MDTLIEMLGNGSMAGPLLGFAIGVVLGLSPVALPTIPAVVGVLAPGRLDRDGVRRSLSWVRVFPSVLAFVFGMNGVLGMLGYVFVSFTVALARSSIVLYGLSATVLGVIGIRLLTRKTSLCRRAETIPPKPLPALLYGVAFSVGGCPGCGPIALGVGSAAALVGGPLYGLLIVFMFVAGHAAVLMAAAIAGSRLLPDGTSRIPWPRLDFVVGLLFMFASAYYVFQLASGNVTNKLPGEPGSGLLP